MDYDGLMTEIEANGLSLYAILQQRLGASFRLGFIRSDVRASVGIARERAEFARYCERSGVDVCRRCGGAGGSRSWPGFVCFDCGGRGWMPKAA